MCGILGIVAHSPVNQLLYDGLLLLQHRGQDAAGIVTSERNSFHMHKGGGMVRDVFRTRDMRNLVGHMGIAHCRYPTAGSAFSSAEARSVFAPSRARAMPFSSRSRAGFGRARSQLSTKLLGEPHPVRRTGGPPPPLNRRSVG